MPGHRTVLTHNPILGLILTPQKAWGGEGTPYILYTYAQISRVWFLACFAPFKDMLFIVYCPF